MQPCRFDVEFVVLGQPVSLKNRKRIVRTRAGKTMLIKSKEAMLYSERFENQCPILDPLLDGDVALWIDAYYNSRRPDLNCVELIKDLLEGRVYKNDRQVKAELALWNLDKENPRVCIKLRKIRSGNCTEMSSLKPSEIWGDAITETGKR